MPSLFDPKTIVAAEYPRMLLGFLAIWCFAGYVMMFFGSTFGNAAVIDTAGLVVLVAEALFILTRDRKGFYTCAGYFRVDEWSRGQRAALAVAEVPFFWIALVLYVIRIVMKQYTLDQQPAPLMPPPKRKRPQQPR